MSYLVFARKYRPGSFADVAGQEHVSRTLSNTIERKRIGHAYLFAGPRGVGKTSVARIFSKSLNCRKGPTPVPCLECTNCKEIAQGTSLAVREIDGASHNSVDNIRDLIDSFRSLPPSGYTYKIYIIDEVHMLSTSAFNALLKSLEEPPPNTIFILATTEIHKIPETVISRCQRFDFRALSHDVVEQRLSEIVLSEKLDVEVGVTRMVARFSDGSMRDAQSLFERIQNFCSGTISLEEASKALGTVGRSGLLQLSEQIFTRRAPAVLEIVNDMFQAGHEPTVVLREFVTVWRELFLAKMGGGAALGQMGLSEDEQVPLLRQVAAVDPADVQDLYYLARQGADEAVRSSFPRYAFEALVVRMATREPLVTVAELLSGSRSAERPKEVQSPATRTVPAAQSSIPARPLNAPSAAPVAERTSEQNTAPPASSALSWSDFLTFVVSKNAVLLAEHLKRLSVTEFSSGSLAAQAPDFTASSINKESARLAQLLNEFSPPADKRPWRVAVSPGNAPSGASSGSATRKLEEQVTEVPEHPLVKSFQKVFPGSKLEQVKTK